MINGERGMVMMLQTCSCVDWGLDLTERGFFMEGFMWLRLIPDLIVENR